MNKPRILIEGVGAIGGVVAGRMIYAGYTPVLVTNNLKITEAVRANGIKVTDPEGEVQVTAEAYTLLDDVPQDDPFDGAFLTMKAQGVVEAAIRTLPLLKPDGYIVTFQNGIVEDAVGEAVGIDRVLSGTVSWNGAMHGPGVYERNTPGDTILGELDGTISDRLNKVADAVRTATTVSLSRNMRGVLWSKLIINASITSVGALMGWTLADMLKRKDVRRVCFDLYGEGVRTAEACGVTLEKITADPYLMYVPPGAGAFTRWRKDLIIRIAARKFGRTKPSMLQSLERGRLTEVDFINGYIVHCGKEHNVATPINAKLVDMIHEIERGERKIAPENIAELGANGT